MMWPLLSEERETEAERPRQRQRQRKIPRKWGGPPKFLKPTLTHGKMGLMETLYGNICTASGLYSIHSCQ